MGVCGVFRPPVQGGSNELISKFLSSMILYNHPSYFKSGEINSCRLSPLPNTRNKDRWSKELKFLNILGTYELKFWLNLGCRAEILEIFDKFLL